MFCLCSSRQQRIHVCYTCLTLCSTRWRPAIVWNFRVYSKSSNRYEASASYLLLKMAMAFVSSVCQMITSYRIPYWTTKVRQTSKWSTRCLTTYVIFGQSTRQLSMQNRFRMTMFHAHTHPVTKTFYAVRINYILHLKYELEWNYSET